MSSSSGSGGSAATANLQNVSSSALLYLDTIKPLCKIPLDIIDYCVDRYERLRLKNDLGHSDVVRFAVDAGSRSGLRPTKHQIRSFEHHSADRIDDYIRHRGVKEKKKRDESDEEEGEEEYEADEVVQFDDVEERKENFVYRSDDNLLTTEAMEYEASPQDALLFFPQEYRQSLSLIADMLAFPRAVHGTRVYLLDILTVLIILLRGSVNDKARYLFTWYNISGSGLMTELEHIMFIQRVGRVLSKMKVLGAADMNIDDIKHMAFEARARKPQGGGVITFVPGLTLRDLIVWIHDSKETRVVFTFFQVFDQLVDSLLLLKSRTDALAAVMAQKTTHKCNNVSVPRMNMMKCAEHGSPCYPVFRSHNAVSLCLSARDCLTTEIFIQVEKLVPSDYTFDVPPAVALMRDKHLHDKNKHVKRKVTKCCNKHFTLESRQRFILDNSVTGSQCPVMRVDISDLEPDSRYVLRAYSEQWRYAPVEVQTLSSDTPRSSCILPACVSVAEAEAFVHYTPQAKAAAMLIYTGSLCSIRTLLEQSLLCFEHDALRPPAGAFANVVAGQAAIEYAYAWEREARRLFGMASAAGVAEDLAWGDLCAAHEKSQVVVYPGMGPWSHPIIREQTKAKIGDSGAFGLLDVSLEHVYATFSGSIGQPCSSWRSGCTRTVFVRPRGVPSGGISAEQLLQMLLQASLADGDSQLVIVIRSPDDLMASPSGGDAEIPALETEGPTVSPTAPDDRHGGPATRLRGRHELLHGEHSSSSAPASVKPSPSPSHQHRAALQGSKRGGDTLLTKLLVALLEWIRQGGKSAARSVSIVSVGWSDGCNFEVRGALAHDRALGSLVAVAHHSLLPTRVQDDLAAPQPMIARLRASAAASDATFQFLVTSGLRSVVYDDPFMSGGDTNPSPGICFLPFNKVSDKTVENSASAHAAVNAIQVLSGPRTVGLSHAEVTVTFRLEGHGHVWCVLYELPALADAVDAVSLVFAERANLREEGRVHQRCNGKTNAVVSFHCLRPYTKYCVSVEPFSEHPRVAYFRSLPMESCPLSSLIVAAVGEDDYSAPSLVLTQKVFHLHDELRCRAAGVYLIHQKLSSGSFNGAPAAPAKIDVDRAYRVCSTVHICLDNRDMTHANQRDRRDFDFDVSQPQPFIADASYERVDRACGGRVHIAINGPFCKLAPRDGSAASLAELVDTCEWLLRSPLSRDLKHVTVLVQRPLVRFLQRNEGSGAYSVDGTFLNRRGESAELFLRLLRWKAAGEGRDVVVLTLADVSSPVIVTVSLRARPSPPPGHSVAQSPAADLSAGRERPPVVEPTLSLQPAATLGYMDFDINIKLRREKEQQELQRKLDEEDLTDDEDDKVLLQRADKFKVASIHGWTGEGDQRAADGTDSDEDSVKSVRTADRFSLLRPRQDYTWTQCRLRHLILPSEDGTPARDGRASIIFPEGRCTLSAHVEYVCAPLTPADEAMEVRLLRPRTDLHGAALNSGRVPAVYVLDLVKAPMQQSFPLVPPAAPSAVNTPLEPQPLQPTAAEVLVTVTDASASVVPRAPLAPLLAPPSVSREYYHSLTARNFQHNIDFVEITLGPVVGAVTEETAVIMLELNADLDKVEIVFKQLMVPPAKAHVVRVAREGILRHRVFCIKASGLRRASVYEMTCPLISGAAPLGVVRTCTASVRAANLLFCGGGAVERLPALDPLLEHIINYQLPDQAHLLGHVYRHTYAGHIAFGGGAGAHEPRYEGSSAQRANGWTWISEYFRGVMPKAEVLVQLGPQTLLPRVRAQLADALLSFHGRVSLPLADANAVAAMYFSQMEEIMRETFRGLLSVPTLRDALAVAPIAPLYHSDYLLPLSGPLRQREGEAGRLLQVVRALFQTQVAAYVSPLYEFNPENMKNHMRVWRSGPLAVVMLDIVTERRRAHAKAQKKKTSNEDGEDAEETKDKHPFSSGFIDRGQWKELKKISKDLTIDHIALCCEKPFIAFEEIPRVHAPAGPLDKGDMPEWAPTVEDLNEFFKFWVKWIRPDETALYTTRNVVLCAAHSFPFTTSVLDLFSGIKFSQMCVGALSSDDSLGYARVNGPSPALQGSGDDMVLSGKIGSFRYVHRFDGLEDVIVNSARDTLASPIVEYNMNQDALLRPGYASMKVWFDSWRATGSWQLVSARGGPARLTCGPVIGAPLPCKKGSKLLVPILFEVDRHCIMTVKCTNVFNADITIYRFKCRPNRPFVQTFGPLDADTRYTFQVISGVKTNYDPTYTINTTINASESNIAVANFAAESSKPQCSEFLLDLVNRCKVPFSGISAVVHLNVAPDLSELMAQLTEANLLVQAVEQIRREGNILTSGSFHALDGVMGVLRAEFRSIFMRPSYADLLKNALNLTVPTRDPVDIEDVDIANARKLMLQLMLCRLHQEYFDQLNFPAENVFRAVRSSEKLRSFVLRGDEEVKAIDEEFAEENPDIIILLTDDPETVERKQKRLQIYNYHNEVMNELELKSVERISYPAQFQSPKAKYVYSDPALHPIEAVFQQWREYMIPAPLERIVWRTPNGRASVESIGPIDERSIVEVTKTLDKSPIGAGVRIIVLESSTLKTTLLDTESLVTTRIHKKLMKLRDQGSDRDICLVSASSEVGGTRVIDLKYETGARENPDTGDMEVLYSAPVPVQNTDNIFRNNEYDRILDIRLNAESLAKAAKEAKKKKKKEGTGGNSKRAQQKRLEEERKAEEERLAGIAAVVAAWVPDGYAMIECRTSVIDSRDKKTDTLTTVATRNINSLFGGKATEEMAYEDPESARPHPGDYMQMPEWLVKFSPSVELFAQDEVLFIMRNEPHYKAALDSVENDAVFIQIMQMYERSRLSELSRPPELREVNMDIPGVVPMLLKSLVARIWDEAVPEAARRLLVTLKDDFVRAYCLGRAVPDPSVLADAKLFARALQYSFVLSMQLKVSCDLSKREDHEHILRALDGPARLVYERAKREQELEAAHVKAEALDPESYDRTKIDEEFAEAERALLAKDDYESDMEELELEAVQREKDELEAEEAEERAERLREQAEEDAELAEDEAAELAEAALAEAEEEEDEGKSKSSVKKNEKEEDGLSEAEREKRVLEMMKQQVETGKAVVQGLEDGAIEFLLLESIAEISRATIEQQDADALALANATKELTDEERLAEAWTHIERLRVERRVARRKLFGKIKDSLLE